MEDSANDAVWKQAEQRPGADRFDFAGGRLLAMIASQWVDSEQFDRKASPMDFAAFCVSIAIRHREDGRAWELVSKRQFELVGGRLFAPLVHGEASTQPWLTAMIKDVALISLARRVDSEFLTPMWFADAEAIRRLGPARLDGCHASDALVASLVYGDVAEHKFGDDAPGRAIEILTEAGGPPTIDSWCTLVMSISDRWTPAVSAMLEKLKVRKPLPSEFLEKIPVDQFTPANACHFSRAILGLERTP
jgi:hypothetical protein